MEEQIYEQILPYLKEMKPDSNVTGRKPNLFLKCPLCGGNANTVPMNNELFCQNKCKGDVGFIGNIVDMVRLCESDKKDLTNDEILKYLGKKYGIEVATTTEKENYFDFYKRNKFDLVPIAAGRKIPIEKDWPNKHHLDIHEWQRWEKDGINFGVKTGAISNITVVDVDQKDIPVDLKEILDKYPTLIQETNKGYHYFYQYVEMPKTRIEEYKVDIENNGGQVVIAPSEIDGLIRTFEDLKPIIPMPEELKNFLDSKIVTGPNKNLDSALEADIKNDNFRVDAIDEGNRHNIFMRMGGILRKELNIEQTAHVLGTMNNHMCNPPLAPFEIRNIVKSIDKYIDFDEKDLSVKILEYLDKVDEATARDVREALGFKKERIDIALSYLSKEGYVVKKSRMYHMIKRAEWKDIFMAEGDEVDYELPYFHHNAVIRGGDLVVIGGKTGTGKTHVAMNIIKRLTETPNAPKPHYISLESGSRFLGIAKHIGLVEGDFNWCVHFSPEDVELEKDTVTIIDWLLPNDYASTDKLYKRFAEQLSKQGGVLIVFVQLRDNGSFFAPDMLEMFPAVVAKFLYEDDEGQESYFQLTKIRESKIKGQRFGKIGCRYNWDKRELQTLDEYEEYMKLKKERMKQIKKGVDNDDSKRIVSIDEDGKGEVKSAEESGKSGVD